MPRTKKTCLRSGDKWRKSRVVPKTDKHRRYVQKAHCANSAWSKIVAEMWKRHGKSSGWSYAATLKLCKAAYAEYIKKKEHVMSNGHVKFVPDDVRRLVDRWYLHGP